MRALLVHNFYGSEAPSGENQVFESERRLLVQNGHSVELYRRYSDEIRCKGKAGVLIGALSTPWNPFSAYKLAEKVMQFNPNVVHAHNTFPLLSPSVFHAASKNSATVLTLHNYRLLCPAAIPMRSGKICTECIIQHSVWPAFQHGCYRDSRVATLPLALNVALHRAVGTWRNKVDAFIALSDFQRDLMIEGGLPAEKVFVKPNFYAGRPAVIPYPERTGQVVFVGRLGAEKGVHALINAWKLWGSAAPALQMVGDGPMREELEAQAQGLPIQFLGQVSAEAAQKAIAKARLVVLPSEWFEGFPMVIREAFAFGTAVAVSNIGPLPSIVEDGKSGVVFESANPKSLLNAVSGLWQTPDGLQQMGHIARMVFEEKYTDDANYAQLMAIYQSAIENAAARRGN